MTNVTRRMRTVKHRIRNMNRGCITTRMGFSGCDTAFLYGNWTYAQRFPAKNLLAGQNVQGQREIPRQTKFGGLKRPRTTQDSLPKPFWRGIPPLYRQNQTPDRAMLPPNGSLLFCAKSHLNVLTLDTVQALQRVLFYRG